MNSPFYRRRYFTGMAVACGMKLVYAAGSKGDFAATVKCRAPWLKAGPFGRAQVAFLLANALGLPQWDAHARSALGCMAVYREALDERCAASFVDDETSPHGAAYFLPLVFDSGRR